MFSFRWVVLVIFILTSACSAVDRMRDKIGGTQKQKTEEQTPVIRKQIEKTKIDRGKKLKMGKCYTKTTNYSPKITV